MADLIDRQAAIDALRMDIDIIPYAKAREYARAVIETVYNRLEQLPAVQPEPSQVARDIATILENEQDMRVILKNAQQERMRGKWLEKEVIDDRKDAKIQQWQQARCSCCNKWHTTPYMYYFVNYDYCPNCGSYNGGED